MKVLLYETDEARINALKDIFNQQDYTLLVEEDAESLFGHLQADAPELIVSNFGLPNGGIDLVNSILALMSPPYPYVLFLTEELSERYAVDCLGPIPGDFIVTPLREEELAARVIVAERTIALQTHLLTQQDLPPDVAMYDDLTNLLNRQAIYEHALAEMNRSQREKKPVCLVMVEVVNAKEVGNQHGNEIRRQAVRFVARAIRANLRMYDLIGRWMDAKFFVVLPGLSHEHADNVVGRILSTVDTVQVRVADGSLLDLQVAGGYTYSEPDKVRPLYELIDEANMALAAAEQGRAKPKLAAYEAVA